MHQAMAYFFRNFSCSMVLLNGIIILIGTSRQGILVNKKHHKTLEMVFKKPVQASVRWDDIEKLIIALGGEISEGSGSRVRIVLNGIRAVFHRPHPARETDKGALMSMRKFLENAGVKYDEI